MTLRGYIVRQFKKPHGALGHLAGWLMAHRPSNRERNAWTIELLNIQPGDRILEIGCGPGLALEMCAKELSGGKIVGVDHSRTMIDQAARRNAHHIDAGVVELHLGDLQDLGALGGPFDKIYSANVAQFFPDKTEAFCVLFNVTVPGGTLASTYMPRGKNPSRLDAATFAEDIKGHMKAAGFGNIRVEEHSLEPVPAVCVLGER